MNIEKLANKLTKLQGKNKKLNVTTVNKLLSNLSDLMWGNPAIHQTLSINGYRRSKRQAARSAKKRGKK